MKRESVLNEPIPTRAQFITKKICYNFRIRSGSYQCTVISVHCTLYSANLHSSEADMSFTKNAHVFLIKNISKLYSQILKFSKYQIKTKIKTMGGLSTSSRCLPRVAHKKYNKTCSLKIYIIFIASKVKVIIHN